MDPPACAFLCDKQKHPDQKEPERPRLEAEAEDGQCQQAEGDGVGFLSGKEGQRHFGGNKPLLLACHGEESEDDSAGQSDRAEQRGYRPNGGSVDQQRGGGKLHQVGGERSHDRNADKGNALLAKAVQSLHGQGAGDAAACGDQRDRTEQGASDQKRAQQFERHHKQVPAPIPTGKDQKERKVGKSQLAERQRFGNQVLRHAEQQAEAGDTADFLVTS